MTNKKEASKIRIKLKSFDHRMIDFSVQQIIEAAERTGASVSAVPLPTRIKRFCVIRSRKQMMHQLRCIPYKARRSDIIPNKDNKNTSHLCK